MSECHFDVTDAMYGASFCHTHGEVHSEVRESQWFAFWEGVNAAVQHWSSGEAIACPYAPQKRAEWEAEGRRWYAACWRDDNGYLNSLESSTVAREYAEADVTRWRAAEAKEDGGQPDRIVLATKIEYPWMPVPDTTGDESEGKA